MKGFWTALTVVFCSVCVLAGCNDYNNSIQTSTGATITNVSPSGVSAGATSDLTITVIASLGNPFPVGTVVEWNGVKLVSTFVDSVTVTAVVPKAYLAKPGTAYVNTFAPQSGTGMNGLSNALAFLVYGAPNPVPTLTSISPATAPACGASCSNVSVSLTVTGTNFLPTSTNGGSTVSFASPGTPDGQPAALTITSLSATQIVAAIPGAFLTSAGAATVTVINPPSGICVLPYCQPLVGGGPNPVGQNQTFTITGSGSNAAAGVAEETPAISQDGRYVAYTAQQNGLAQIFLRDTCVGGAKDCAPETHMVSASSENVAGNADSHTPSMSPDGRYIAYSSASTNLLAGAPTGRQIFLHDTCLGAPTTCKTATTLISTDSQGALTGTESILPSVSSSGRFVAFVSITPAPESQSTPRIAGTNGATAAASTNTAANSGLRQVFIRDTCTGVANCTPKTTRISLEPGDGQQNNSKPAGPALSGLAKQIALANGKSATVFTPTVPVDDRVFLAITSETK
jgi:trimeric autotransporter adhesin